MRKNVNKGPQTFEDTAPPSDPLAACREALAAVVLEIRQRRLKDVRDHALLSHARRLMLLARDLEREQEKANRPPWWRRWWVNRAGV